MMSGNTKSDQNWTTHNHQQNQLRTGPHELEMQPELDHIKIVIVSNQNSRLEEQQHLKLQQCYPLHPQLLQRRIRLPSSRFPKTQTHQIHLPKTTVVIKSPHPNKSLAKPTKSPPQSASRVLDSLPFPPHKLTLKRTQERVGLRSTEEMASW
ncbi:hypothetical protein Droror1_Dr00023473 [Drosera rotundifolia]